MKTRPIELIVISLLLAAVGAASLLFTSFLVPLTKRIFVDYHVVADVFLWLFLYLLLSSLVVRLLLKFSPLEAETYGFEGFGMLSNKAFFWKVLTSVTEMGGMFFLPVVPLFLRPLFFSLYGAKIGKNVEIAGKLVEPHLISIDEYAFIGGDTFITAHAVVHDMIILKPIKINKKVTIGVGAIIMPGVEIGENSIVAPGSLVPMDTVIPPNEYWSGMPAARVRGLKGSKSSASRAA